MPRQTDKRVLAELAAIAAEADAAFVGALNDLAEAAFRKSLPKRDAALAKIAAVLGTAMAKADLAGRKHLLEEANKFAAFDPLAPLTIAEKVTLFYVQWHAPQLGSVINQNVVERVADAVAKGRDSAVEVLQEVGGWNRAYADTVYRTNLASAHSAGRFQQLQDPAVLEVVPALQLSATGDKDTRPNHLAASGLVAGVNDPIWEIFSTPLGFMCRCAMRLVDRFELQQRGLLLPNGKVKIHYPSDFANAHPDPGFGIGRPDHRIYGAEAA